MHARNRTWLLGSDPVERCRQRTLPVEGGDGSTLSLDFTTGVLDPRLTFTRTTNATFINSQGLVQYAGQNLYFNTAFGGLSGTNPSLTSSGWTYAFSTGSATFHGDGSVTMTASSQRIGIARSSGFTGAGRRIIASVDILTVGDTGLTPSNLLTTGTFTNSAYYVNSGLYTAGNVTGPCTLSFVFDSPTSGTTGAYFGVGMSSNSTAEVKFANPRLNLWNGVVPAPYLENTSTTAERHDPRFDYDPSTTPPQPRGLLIEGSAINYMLESNSLTGYSNSGMAVVTAGSDSNPTGIANSALQIYATVGGTFHGYYRTITAGTNTQVTVSIWAKARTYTHLFLSDLASGRAAVRFNLSTGATDNNFGAGYVSAKATPFPNGWWRCEMVVNVTASTAYGWAFVGVPSGATLGQFGAQYTGTGNAADGIYCYGFQVEGGSGASSYIPTGASTGSRGQDAMTMTDISSLNFNQSGGTVMMQIDGGPRDLNTFPYFAQFEKSPSGRGWGFLRMNISSTVGPRIFGTAFDNAGSVIITASNHLRPSGKIKFATSLEPSVARMTWVIAGGSALVNTAAAGTLATIGSLKFNNTTETAATDFGSVWVSQFKYWPTVLPESQMQALTT
jgi:hypothetical protein